MEKELAARKPLSGRLNFTGVAAVAWLILLCAALGFSVKYGVELTRVVSDPSSTIVHQGPIRIGVFNWPGFYPLVAAQKRGLFKKYGVEVELIEGKTIGELNDWIRTGKTQATVGVLADFVILRSLGTPIQMMFASDYSLADVIIGRPSIGKPADLAGKRIGLAELNSYAEYFVVRSLEIAGVNLRNVQLRTVPAKLVPEAILNNEIDAGHTWDPSLTEGLQRGLRPILSSSENPRLVIDGVAFRQEVVRDLEATIAISRAFFEAQQMQKSEPVEFAAIAANYFRITPQQAQKFIDEDVKFTDLDENINLFQNSGSLRIEAVEIVNFFDERGLGADPGEITKLIDDTVVRRLEDERTMGAKGAVKAANSESEVSWLGER